MSCSTLNGYTHNKKNRTLLGTRSYPLRIRRNESNSDIKTHIEYEQPRTRNTCFNL